MREGGRGDGGRGDGGRGDGGRGDGGRGDGGRGDGGRWEVGEEEGVPAAGGSVSSHARPVRAEQVLGRPHPPGPQRGLQGEG